MPDRTTASAEAPEIRVFLLTFRRPVLLARALRSLLAQTWTNWVCEVHNDAPDDDSPREVIAEVARGDPRILYVVHPRNLGAVGTFNGVFRPVAERFGALLEDDNWWDPDLLATLRETLLEHPKADLVWANMRVMREQPDRSWIDTEKTIWPVGPGTTTFTWPHPIQITDALHSHGAMLFRAGARPPPPVPGATPFAQIEPARERILSGELVLVHRPLANFALTLQTARSRDPGNWLEGQLLLAGSFLLHVPLTPAAWTELWRAQRGAHPPNTNLFLLLALAGIARRPIVAQASWIDWLRLARSVVRHPWRHVHALRFRRHFPEVWSWMEQAAATRTEEAKQRGFVILEIPLELEKNRVSVP